MTTDLHSGLTLVSPQLPYRRKGTRFVSATGICTVNDGKMDRSKNLFRQSTGAERGKEEVSGGKTLGREND